MVKYNSGEFSLVYHGQSYDFRETNNLMYITGTGVNEGELHDTEEFIFTCN